MQILPLIFLLCAWAFVLGLTIWSFKRLLQSPQDEKLPPPGTLL